MTVLLVLAFFLLFLIIDYAVQLYESYKLSHAGVKANLFYVLHPATGFAQDGGEPMDKEEKKEKVD